MSCKEAIKILTEMKEGFEANPDETVRSYIDALGMAITALQIQDGNLYLKDIPDSLSIGRVQGNVYMYEYPDKFSEGKMFIR